MEWLEKSVIRPHVSGYCPLVGNIVIVKDTFMSFFISDAMAEGAAAAQEPSMIAAFAPLLILFAVFYFLLIRPQSKRQKEHKQMLGALGKNDEVVTSGGLVGRVVELDEAFLTLEVANNVQVRVQRNMLAQVLPKGSYKPVVAKPKGKKKADADNTAAEEAEAE